MNTTPKYACRHGRARSLLLLSAATLFPVFGLAEQARADEAAADQVETITVTAEKRAENIQSVPASISAFSGTQLEDANITNFADLANLIPNLAIITANNNRNTTI